MDTHIDWPDLLDRLVRRFALPAGSIHGPAHWERVGRHAMHAAAQAGGDVLVARLFSLFHDVCRENDGDDPRHGARGAQLAAAWRGRYFALPDAQCDLLCYACTWHTAGGLSDDPTIGACWDGDRLDIWRAGYRPRARFMSTDYARALVRAQHVGPQYLPQPLSFDE